MNLLFILYNILEIKNGVSNKYIEFIKYLESSPLLHNISIIMTEINHRSNEQDNFHNQHDFQRAKLYYVKGCKVPFYDKIKIPNINHELLDVIIKNQNYIILFNGEFIWLYNRLLKFKENHCSSLLLFPTWHTDYESYFQKYINFSNNKNHVSYLMKELRINLEKKYFQGMVVTGGYMEDKFKKYSEHVFNANELCASNFKTCKIDSYQEKSVLHFIYCGRVSIEKNIDELFELLENFKMNPFEIHIIGNGPYLKTLQEKYPPENNKTGNKNNFFQVHYYGEVDYSKIQNIYQKLDNRIFIMCSETETFGKAPMEAGLTGIPIFIKQSKNIQYMYNNENAFIFENKFDFINQLLFFLKMNKKHREKWIVHSIQNIRQYDQSIIFPNWEEFLNCQWSSILNHDFQEGNIRKSIENSGEDVKKSKIRHLFHMMQCSMDVFST